MIKKLAEIATKLDRLGLTKEADVLDLYLAKIGSTIMEAPIPAVAALPYRSDLPSGMQPGVPAAAPPAKRMAKNWADYAQIIGGTDAAQIRNAWEGYARESGSDPSFEAYVSWWKSMKGGGMFRDHGSPTEVCSFLARSRVSAATPASDGPAQASSGPEIPHGAISGGGGSNVGAGDLFQKDQFGNRIVPKNLSPAK